MCERKGNLRGRIPCSTNWLADLRTRSLTFKAAEEKEDMNIEYDTKYETQYSTHILYFCPWLFAMDLNLRLLSVVTLSSAHLAP